MRSKQRCKRRWSFLCPAEHASNKSPQTDLCARRLCIVALWVIIYRVLEGRRKRDAFLPRRIGSVFMVAFLFLCAQPATVPTPSGSHGWKRRCYSSRIHTNGCGGTKLEPSGATPGSCHPCRAAFHVVSNLFDAYSNRACRRGDEVAFNGPIL